MGEKRIKRKLSQRGGKAGRGTLQRGRKNSGKLPVTKNLKKRSNPGPKNQEKISCLRTTQPRGMKKRAGPLLVKFGSKGGSPVQKRETVGGVGGGRNEKITPADSCVTHKSLNR